MNDDKNEIDIMKSSALALMQDNRLAEAQELYSKVATICPGDVDALYMLSSIYGKLGRIDDAEIFCRRVLALQHDHGDTYINLGHIYSRRGNYEEALSNYKMAARYTPDSATAHFYIGNILNVQGQQEAAIENYQQAIRLSPTHADAHNNLGTTYLRRGNFNEAFSCYEKALDINPLYLTALNGLAQTCQSATQREKYLEYYRLAIARSPDPTEARSGFIKALRTIGPVKYVPWLDEELQKCFLIPDIEYKPLAFATAHLLKGKYGLEGKSNLSQKETQALTEQIGSDELFIMYMEKVINTDADLESLFITLRRTLLFKSNQIRTLSQQDVRVIAALAFQCFNTEHIFVVDAEEEIRLADLKNAIQQQISGASIPSEYLEYMLFILGMYEDLHSVAWSGLIASLPIRAWSKQFRSYLELSLFNYLEEQQIKEDIETVGTIKDQTTQLVQSQYELNPYPRWLSISKKKKEKDNAKLLKSIIPHFNPPQFLKGPISVLIAGCGTGQQAIRAALAYRNAEITAIDISSSSLAYAIRMAHKYAVKNIKFMQGDILESAELKRRFHIIECGGVLHHMKDPLAGWKVLTGLLVKDGLMRIGLYSELARKPIVATREIIEKEAVTPDSTSIRNFRARIIRREFGDILYGTLRYLDDFYSTSECRDLLFHYQEHRYTLPQLARTLNELNLEFIGFELKDIGIARLYREYFPEDKDMRDLALWDRFENLYPTSFMDMYNFWCKNGQKNRPVR
ncbi:MAG: tetratricopeptide repeat protein [Gammaproteobacteria bacterium]